MKKLNRIDEIWEALEASKNSLCRDEVLGADTLQGPETKCDTEGFRPTVVETYPEEAFI